MQLFNKELSEKITKDGREATKLAEKLVNAYFKKSENDK